MGGNVKVVLELFEVCVVDFHFGGSKCKVLQLKNGCFVLIHVSSTSWFLIFFNCGHCNNNQTIFFFNLSISGPIYLEVFLLCGKYESINP